MKVSANILFVGPLRTGSTTLHRLNALRDLGHNVRAVNSWHNSPLLHPYSILERLSAKAYRLGLPAKPKHHDWENINRSILNELHSYPFDALWIDKGLAVEPETLICARQASHQIRIIGYSPDDMAARHNHSKQFLDCLPFYDIFFTTKSYNVPELKELGCPEVCFVDNAYDPNTHRPVRLTQQQKEQLGGRVGFVGSFEQQRANSMKALAKAGFPIRIYGGNWKRYRGTGMQRLQVEAKSMIGEDYPKAISSFDINLHFLRKANRDQQTTRSIEIPACGKLMIAERTHEHQALFEEDKEAIFFDSDEELIDKVKYFCQHPEEAQIIGLAGRERCIKSEYSNHHRMGHMLSKSF
jgi:spore maturation protein CgeB